MDLRAQLTAVQVIAALEKLMAELQDIAVWGKSDGIEDDRDRYLSWVTKAEQQLGLPALAGWRSPFAAARLPG